LRRGRGVCVWVWVCDRERERACASDAACSSATQCSIWRGGKTMREGNYNGTRHTVSESSGDKEGIGGQGRQCRHACGDLRF